MDEFNLIVYFLKNPKTGIVKIGKAKDFDKRYKTLCREEKCELEILLTVHAEDTERQLHAYFSESRAYKNEWFKDDSRLRELIEASKNAGHLVFPEGAPYRDLPVDMRREVKKQGKDIEHLSGKVNSLSQQLNQARYKRDEYKKLSSSAKYYKDILDIQRKTNKEKEKRSLFISWLVMMISIILMFLPVIIKTEWASRITILMQLIAYVSANLFFYRDENKTKIKEVNIVLLFFRIIFFVGMLITLFAILYMFITGV